MPMQQRTLGASGSQFKVGEIGYGLMGTNHHAMTILTLEQVSHSQISHLARLH